MESPDGCERTPPRRQPMVVVSFKADRGLVSRVIAFARRTRRSRGSVIREALERELAPHEGRDVERSPSSATMRRRSEQSTSGT
jgi:hypothetical protein